MDQSQVPEGVFWADYIKTLKDNPEARLAVARQHFPLPAAFREAAIALRAQIRERRKEKRSYEDLLQELYRTAAQENFLLGTPYIEGIGPGFNVATHIPEDLWQNLPFPYAKIGHEYLPLLSKTDKKWLDEAWGEPEGHQGAQGLYREVFDEYVQKTLEGVRARNETFRQEFDELLAQSTDVTATPESERRRSGCLGLLALLANALTPG